MSSRIPYSSGTIRVENRGGKTILSASFFSKEELKSIMLIYEGADVTPIVAFDDDLVASYEP